MYPAMVGGMTAVDFATKLQNLASCLTCHQFMDNAATPARLFRVLHLFDDDVLKWDLFGL